MDRRSCLALTALGATGLAMSLPARAATALPIVLYVDLSVDPAREKEFLATFFEGACSWADHKAQFEAEMRQYEQQYHGW